jgi:zinc protease
MSRAVMTGALALAGVLLFAAAPAARAETEIQRVISPGGIEAWLVEEHAIPIIGVTVTWSGGSAYDPAGKEGVAYLLSATLDEGAGTLDSEAFRSRLADTAIEISFETGQDDFNGQIKMLTEKRDEAFGLLRMALTEPRFDQEVVGRMKRDIVSEITRDAQRPNEIANRAWYKLAFGDAPYARPREGTAETVLALGPNDLRAFHRRLIRKDGMKISVVGDIDAATLARLLDETFGGLPQTSDLKPLAPIAVGGPAYSGVEADTPQTVIRFGFAGLLRDDSDFVPAFILNHILGGGTFSSRLYEEVREKRGLAYGVSTGLRSYDAAGVWIGGTATRADRAAESISVIRAELERFAAEGPTEAELDAARTYLTGAYPLRFDTNSKIARQLSGIQRENLGIDYIARRNGMIEAVTLDDLKRVAARLLKPENLIVVVVGRPDSLAKIRMGG